MNYDNIASTYNQRYAVSPMAEVAQALSRLAENLPLPALLEVGCGTGHWLAELRQPERRVFGLDASVGMLRQAQAQGLDNLTNSDATRLPFKSAVFGLVFCVNAFHHFSDRLSFLAEARRLLASGGALAILTMDPHAPGNHMYIYDFFDEVWKTDLHRFAPQQTLMDWMAQAGFSSIRCDAVKRTQESFAGDEVWKDPFLEKNSTSQLALLSDDTYQAGLQRMRTAIQTAKDQGESPPRFETDITFYLLSGVVAH